MTRTAVFCTFLFFAPAILPAQDDAEIQGLIARTTQSPHNELLQLRLGYAYLQRKRYTNAEHHYKKASRINTRSHDAKLGLALVYVGLKRERDAERTLKDMLRGDRLNYYGNLYRCLLYTSDAADE